MNEKLPIFLKKDKESILFNIDGEFIFYIPELYFERKYVIVEGEYVNMLGVLDYEVINESGKSLYGIKQFKFPSIFLSKPSTIEKVKALQISKNSSIQDYRLLKYNKGDQIIVSFKVPQLIANVEEFFKLFISGKQSKNIQYNTIQDYYLEAMALNGNSYGVTTQLLGVCISELYRDPTDLSKPYRLYKGFNNINYETIPIKEISKYISPYVAITSENWDEAVVSAIINKNTTYSPMEKLLTD